MRSTRINTIAIAMVCVALVAAGCQPPDRQGPRAPAPAAASAGVQPGAAPQRITTKTGIEMVLVPAGEFVMGDDRGEDDEKPAHRVRLSAFYIDVHEVTQASYQAMMGKNPAKFQGADLPVERLSWFAATQYCNMRSLREGLKPCYNPETLECDFAADGYRLPTEAEWEYACRAGTGTRWSFGDDASALADYAWFQENAGKRTHAVGEKRPNPWGLYDMHGNVAEWCNDYYAEGYRPQEDAGGSGTASDPRGPASGEERVLRGGSWASSPDACRCAARASEAPGFADVCFGYEAYGFRCVRRAGAGGELP